MAFTERSQSSFTLSAVVPPGIAGALGASPPTGGTAGTGQGAGVGASHSGWTGATGAAGATGDSQFGAHGAS